MNIPRIQFVMRAGAILIAGAGAAAIAMGLLWPINAADDALRSQSGSQRPRDIHQVLHQGAPSPEVLQEICNKTLRPAWVTAATLAVPRAPMIAAPVVQQSSLTSLTLVGTIGDDLAMVRGPDGTIEIAGVGDQINDADVVAVQRNRITLRMGARLINIVKQPDAQ